MMFQNCMCYVSFRLDLEKLGQNQVVVSLVHCVHFVGIKLRQKSSTFDFCFAVFQKTKRPVRLCGVSYSIRETQKTNTRRANVREHS